jgi:hypothetical protein
MTTLLLQILIPLGYTLMVLITAKTWHRNVLWNEYTREDEQYVFSILAGLLWPVCAAGLVIVQYIKTDSVRDVIKKRIDARLTLKLRQAREAEQRKITLRHEITAAETELVRVNSDLKARGLL